MQYGRAGNLAPADPLLQANRHLSPTEGPTMLKSRIASSGLDGRNCRRLRQSVSACFRGASRSDGHRRAWRGRRDRLAHRSGSREGRGQSRFSPRRTDDRAAGPCGRCAEGRPGRRPARSPDPGQCAAIGGSQSRVARGGADPGAPHLLAAAGTPEGRLDASRQFRRGPAEAPDRRGAGRLRTGAAADRAGTAELHDLVRRRPGRRHRGRRRAGRSGPRRADGRAARASGRTRRRLRRSRAAHPNPVRATRRSRSPSAAIRR